MTQLASSYSDRIEAHIQGPVTGQVAVGKYIVQIGEVHGGEVNVQFPDRKPHLQLRSSRLPLPRPQTHLLDRKEEVAAAQRSLHAQQPVEFYGETGIGTSALLRHLGHFPNLPYADGVVYLHARTQPVADLLQALFEVFYETDIPYKPSNIEIRHILHQHQPLVLLDDNGLSRVEVEELLNSLPNFGFLLASADRCLWAMGHAIWVSGLPLAEGQLLIEQELGRLLTPAEQQSAQTLCLLLKGNPRRILAEVDLAKRENRALAEVVRSLQADASERSFVDRLLASLHQPQRWALALLAAFAGIALSAESVAAMGGLPEFSPLLTDLVHRHLLSLEGDRYQLAPDLAKVCAQVWDLNHSKGQALSYFTRWAEQHSRSPHQILQESEPLLDLLNWAAAARRWGEVLRLARVLEIPLALGKRWGAWEQVLQHLLQAGRAIGDQAVMSYALHQLGTRALCLEDPIAREQLTEALQIRESAGDRAGAAVTQHNLNFLIAPPLPPQGSEHWLKWLAMPLFLSLTGLVIWHQLRQLPPPLPLPPIPSPPEISSPTPTAPSESSTLSSGTATSPDRPVRLAVEPAQLNFGNPFVGDRPPSRTVTLRNQSTAAITLLTPRLSGRDHQAFAIHSSDCVQGAVLQPGETCQINLHLSPTYTGNYQATLAIARQSGQPQTVTLTGNVRLRTPDSIQPEILRFAADPDTIQRGDRIELCYETLRAKQAIIDPVIGRIAVGSDCVTVTPSATTTYTLTATSRTGEQVQRNTTITVIDLPPKILFFSPNSSTLTFGQQGQLCYGVADASSATIAPPVGSVAAVPKDCVAIAPQKTTTYTLTATNSQGRSAQQSTTVTVLPAPPPKITFFNVDPLKNGTFRLCYGVTDANRAEISNIGSVPVLPEHCLPPLKQPSNATQYTLTVTGIDGSQITQTVTVLGYADLI
jgi:hypothetical protein